MEHLLRLIFPSKSLFLIRCFMEYDEETKKSILRELLMVLTRFSDKEYQKRVWIRAEGPECDDFDEAANQFFDVADPILEEYKDFQIMENQQNLLMEFRHKLDLFNRGERPYSPEEFIDTREWGEIVEIAKNVLRAFEYDRK